MHTSAAFVLALACAAPAKAAQPAPSGSVAAEALFDEGRRLMTAGSYAEACPKFLASQKLDPAVGTLLNLGECWAKAGRTATAWATFRDVVAEAHRMGDAKREAVATARLDALGPRLSKLAIVLPEGARGTDVTRDGVRVDPGEWNVPIPVDPGEHVIEARAAGKKTWRTAITIGEAATLDVKVPALDAEATADGEDAKRGDTQRVAAVVALGVGVIGVGIGTYFGLRAKSAWDDASSHCNGDVCPAGSAARGRDADSRATVSTIAFVAGGIALAGGAALWLTAPRTKTTAMRVAPFGLGLAVVGSY